jgi:hypothetical protein
MALPGLSCNSDNNPQNAEAERGDATAATTLTFARIVTVQAGDTVQFSSVQFSSGRQGGNGGWRSGGKGVRGRY